MLKSQTFSPALIGRHIRPVSIFILVTVFSFLAMGLVDYLSVDIQGWGRASQVFAQTQTIDASLLASHWSLNEGTGTTAGDSSGSNTGVIQGATWTQGISGNALSFDGVNDSVSIGQPQALTNLGPHTLSLWVKRAGTGMGYLIAKRTDGQTGYWRLGYEADALTWFKDTSGSTHVMATSATNLVPLNTWTHVALTWDGTVNGTGIHIYVNGQEVSYAQRTTGTGSVIPDAGNNFTIGSRNGASAFFTGSLDDVRVYTRVLTQVEVQTIMNAAGN